ncbi:MAG: protein kinase [Pirellulaceae bacterium]|nr:protein kinase [Pirellulaceae bacterium]
MLQCPFCNADLGAGSARLRGGRCPQCGGILNWNETKATLAAIVPQCADDDEECKVSMRDIVRTLVERGGPAASPADSAVSPPKSPPAPVNPLLAPPPAASPEARANVEKIWATSLTHQARPGATLKAASSAPDPAVSSLHVRPHRIVPPGHASEPDAEYELMEVIGEGGVGIVYAARQASIDRTVALKVLRQEFAHKTDHRNKFLSEAVVTGELDHPNIVPIHDLGTSDEGNLFYAMKRVRGTPWSQVIAARSLAENLRILRSVADAIAFAHSRGVIHRDLKPENVMLGDFGEVLVMDWGIALSTPMFVKSGRISQSTSMGGTPAYMAPEMATGPLDTIGPAADVYLLGAILYEIITGKAPHTGRDVMACLYAAARNEIQPTDKTGELLDIALKAMSTLPANRYASVQDFQAAVREYESHSESILLSARADEELDRARRSRDYQDFARALFGFQEARELWSGNQRAPAGEVESRLAYAAAALGKNDFDLGISLLDPRHPAQTGLHRQLVAARRDRDTRQARLRGLRRIALGLAAAIFAVVTGGLFWIGRQYREIEKSNTQLNLTITQLNSTTKALKTETDNLNASKLVLEGKERALQAQKSQLQIEKQRADAEADAARTAQQAEMAASYLAQIGVSAERIANNSFLDARRLLSEFQGTDRAYFRHWEWSYLTRLCGLDKRSFEQPARVECLARSADGGTIVAGLSNGQVKVWQANWNAADLVPLETLQCQGSVSAVAVSPDGRLIAATGESSRGLIQLWTRPAGGDVFAPARPINGHRAGILCLAFSPTAAELLSGSRDETARRWNLATGAEIEVFRGHFGPVWSVAYAPTGGEAATAGEDATVRIWTFGQSAKPRIYRGHSGAVYAVAFAPVGGLVASGGRDRLVHVWDPATVQPFDFASVERELSQELRGVNAPQARQTRHTPLYSLAGHGGEVRAVDFAADGQQVASAAHDNTVRVWRFRLSPTDAERSRVLRGHGGWVRGCALSPDSRLAVSGGHDEQVKLWDIAAYEEVRPLRGHDDAVLWAAFSHDGQRIVTASRDRRAILWSRDGQTPPLALAEEADRSRAEGPVAKLQEGHEFLVTTALFFPPGDRRILTAAGDNTVRIWDRYTGGQLRRLDGTGTISVAAISPDGKWIVTGSDGKDALLWSSDSAAPPQRLTGNLAEVSAAAFAPVSRPAEARIATGDVAGTIRLWRMGSEGKWVAYAHLRGHEQGYTIAAVQFTPDGRRLLSACQDHTLMIWDAATGQRVPGGVHRHPDAIRAFDLSADGTRAVTLCSLGGESYRLFAWNLASGTEVHCDVNLPGESLTGIVFDRGGKSAIVNSSTGDSSRLWRWDLSSPSLTPLWPENRIRGILWAAMPAPEGDHLLAVGGSQARLFDLATGEPIRTFSPHGAVTSANFSPGGERVATSSIDGDVKIWITAPGEEGYGRVALKIPRAHAVDGVPYGVNFAVFAPQKSADGSLLLATAGDDGLAKLWRVADREATLVATFTGHEGSVRSVAISPEGGHLLTAADDGTARLWPIADPAVKPTQYGHPAAVLFAGFSPDGRQIITGCDDNIARVFAVENGRQPLLQLEGHTAAVTCAEISADGRRAVTASHDGMARLWDLEGPKEVLALKRHGAEVTSVHFSPDGRGVLTSSLDQTALVWPSVNISPSIKLSSRQSLIAGGANEGLIDPAAMVRDPDSLTLAGGTLNVELADAGPAAETSSPLSLEVLAAGSLQVRENDVLLATPGSDPRLIATISRPADSPRKLTLALTDHCTPAAAEQLLRAIGWRGSFPAEGEFSASFQLSDGPDSLGNVAEIRLAPAPLAGPPTRTARSE